MFNLNQATLSNRLYHITLHSCRVIFLFASAVIMTQKIFQLEGRLSSGVAQESSADSKLHSQSMYGSLYYLNREHHTWTCERFHSVLEANIVVLDKVGAYHDFIA